MNAVDLTIRAIKENVLPGEGLDTESVYILVDREFTIPAVDSTVDIHLNDTTAIQPGMAFYAVGYGTFHVDYVRSTTYITATNLGANANQDPGTVVPAHTMIMLAPGVGQSIMSNIERQTLPIIAVTGATWPVDLGALVFRRSYTVPVVAAIVTDNIGSVSYDRRKSVVIANLTTTGCDLYLVRNEDVALTEDAYQGTVTILITEAGA